jgi:hypothetical protein
MIHTGFLGCYADCINVTMIVCSPYCPAGPHDAALMIRWFCSFFLEEHLPVAGVLQQADGSSRQPPGDAFQPLHVLLQQVQQGSTYMPHNAMPAGRASTSQLLLAMPASPPPRHVIRAQQQQQQQQQDGLTLPRCKAGLPVVEEGLVAAATACGEEPALPISTVSSEPAATPTGRHAVSSSAGGGSSSWGSAGGFSPPQQQQQCEGQVVGSTTSSSSSAGLTVQQQMAARLRDAARLEASPMCSAVASPVVGHSSDSGNAARLAPGSLSFDGHTGSSKLSSKAVISSSSSSHTVERASRSSGGGWGIQAVQDALGSVGSAVEGLAMQVAEGLDSLDSMANAAAAEPAADDVEGGNVGVTAEGSNSALDFVADFPQLFPAAVMSDVVQQRHSAAGSAAQQQQSTAGDELTNSLNNELAEQQQQQPGLTAAASGAVADMSEFAAEAVRQVRSVVAAAQLPGVWRVESLHQMLRAVSPEPVSRAPAAGKSKR